MIDLNIITKIILMSCNEVVLVPLIIGGFLGVDRKIFGHATILLMSIMILNSFLKSIFQIPLPPHLNIETYAFPSGHMSSAITFYGWLALNTKNNFIRFILVSLIAGVGYSLIHKGFHNIYDIAGSIFFSAILLGIYTWLARTKQISNNPPLLGYLMITFLSVIIWYFSKNGNVPNHVLMAFMTLIGFTLSWTFFANSIRNNASFLSAVVGSLCIIGIYYLSSQLKIAINMPYNLQWAIVGIFIPIAAKLTSGINLRR